MKNSKKVFGLFAFLLVCGNANAGSVEHLRDILVLDMTIIMSM